jgi:acetylornithine deacetylase/succinyl-diaminopimelate desuccinylase-like protein
MSALDLAAVTDYSARAWRDDIEPALHDFIRIPNLSPAFDPEWREHGHMDAAVVLVRDWCASRGIAGATVTVHELPGRTPVVIVDVPPVGGGKADDVVVIYGHLDKQPEMYGWRDDLGPWKPVRQGDRLYGRGGSDDGYAAFAALGAIEAVRAGGGAHARCVVLIEASEESGSPDLPAHIDALAETIGTPTLIVCLDSGCHDYDRLWATTSLRGLVNVVLRVSVLREGVHSGVASGVVPSTFRIMRQLLDRLEDPLTGRVLIPALHTEIPADRREEATATAAVLDHPISADFPFLAGSRPMVDDPVEQMINSTWRPTLSITGGDGLPLTANAGNVLRPFTELRLSFRLPPTVDHEAAARAVEAVLRADPPYGATITLSGVEAGPGWNSPSFAPWLRESIDAASRGVFGKPAETLAEGGSIPFMTMLGGRFPDAQFLVIGVGGPESNAHGPNEFLHLPMAERITSCVAAVLHDHARR